MDQAVAGLEAQLARCDSKASLLLGLSGALAAVAVTAAAEHPPPSLAAAVGACGLAVLAVAVGLLLAAVRPNTAPLDVASWPHWSRCTPQQIEQQLADDTDRRPAQIAALSRLAARKYARIRRSCDALAVGLVLLAAAGSLAAI